MGIQKVASCVYQIPLGAVNSFFIDDQDQGGTLVDCGYEHSEGKIFKALATIGRQPEDIKRLILTHSHPDHAGAAAALKKMLRIPVIMHSEDALLARQGIAGRLPHIRTPGIVNWLVYRLLIRPKPNAIPSFTADQLVTNGDLLGIAGGIRVIEAPGHSLGQIVLLLEKENLLIAADICANMDGLALSTVYEDRDLGRKVLKQICTDYVFDKAVFGHGKAILSNAGKKMAAAFA